MKNRLLLFSLVGLSVVVAAASQMGLKAASKGPRPPQVAAIADHKVINSGGATFGGHVGVGDLDGDGRDEALVGDIWYLPQNKPGAESGAVHVYSTPGLSLQQTIVPPSIGYPAANNFASWFDVGDANGNGIPDLAVGLPAQGQGGAYIYVYFDGDTTSPWLSDSFGGITWGHRVVIDDVTGDGLEDLVAADHAGMMGVFFGPMTHPNGVFPDVWFNRSGFGDVDDLVTADLDGDGIRDVVVGDAGRGEVELFAGGSWSFRALISHPEPPAKGTGSFGYDIEVADADQDGDLDVLVGAPWQRDPATNLNKVGAGYLFLGPDFQTYQAYRSPGPPVAKSYFGEQVGIAELTFDGVPDLYFSAPEAPAGSGTKWPQGRIEVFDGGDPSRGRIWDAPFTPGKRYPLLFGQSVAHGDLDGDGVEELVVGSPKTRKPDGTWDSFAWVYVLFPRLDLSVSSTALSEGSGVDVSVQLSAGAARAGEPYLLLGSLSGTTPGFSHGTQTVPLNPDAFLLAMASVVEGGGGAPFAAGWTGTLDRFGEATATLQIPAPLFTGGAGLPGPGGTTAGPFPGLVGTRISMAYLAGPELDDVSRPVTVEVVP